MDFTQIKFWTCVFTQEIFGFSTGYLSYFFKVEMNPFKILFCFSSGAITHTRKKNFFGLKKFWTLTKKILDMSFCHENFSDPAPGFLFSKTIFQN